MPSAAFDEHFMRMALREAEKAAADGEVPTGCVIVEEPEDFDMPPSSVRILGRAHNQAEGLSDATAHAEMLALTAAFQARGNWRLVNTRLYVTKEPCPMCAGAIYKARIPKVVVGVIDRQQGCLGGCLCLHTALRLYHRVSVEVEPLEDACERMLKTFFELRRQRG